MGTSALDSLILCLLVKNWLILLVCFLPMTLKKWPYSIKLFQNKTKLIKQTKKIIKKKKKFNQEINQRKLCSQILSKYVAAFDCVDKVLIVFSITSGGVCIISSVSIVGAQVGISGASFILIFSLTTGVIKKLPSITRNEKKKHDKILMLVKSKLNSIETLVSQALMDMEISHEEYDMILKKKISTKRWKKMWGV